MIDGEDIIIAVPVFFGICFDYAARIIIPFWVNVYAEPFIV